MSFAILVYMTFLLAVPAWAWLLLSASGFTLGEYVAKKWALQPSLGLATVVVLTYAVSTLAWLPVLLHKNQISLMGTLWLVLATVATVSVGVFAFHEQLSAVQWVGVGLALAALALLGA